MTTQKRNSSIELLRILAACSVMILHYNGMFQALDVASGLSKLTLSILESLCICAVDLFIMISGYYLCYSKERTWGKPIYLILQLSIIVSVDYLIKALVIQDYNFSFTNLLLLLFPPRNYFINLYLTLYVISPFINLTINRLNNSGRNTLILAMVFLFSIHPTFIDSIQIFLQRQIEGISTVGINGQQQGYTIVNFALCYCLGAYLRLNNISEKVSSKKAFLYFILSVLCVFIWYLVEKYYLLLERDYNSLSYSNPFVLSSSFFIITLFTKIHFTNKWINNIAKASFVCFIVHISILPYLKIEHYARIGGITMLLHLTLTVLSIYLISWVIWRLLEFCLEPIRNKANRYYIIRL